jgi:hypothetical protein
LVAGELHNHNGLHLVKSKLNEADFLTGNKLQDVLLLRSLYTPCVIIIDSKIDDTIASITEIDIFHSHKLLDKERREV